MDTQTQIDRLIELAIIQRSELKQLVEQLPQLREHLNAEVEKVFDETEPQLRAELEEWTTKQTTDKTAALGVALEAKIADLAKSLEVSTQARYNAIIAERAENARLAAQAEAKIAEHAASLPSAVKDIVTAELARFPRAGEIDQLRKEFAEPRGLNPRGKWQAGETYNKLDLVTINGDSYTSNTDGNRTRPSRSSADWTLVAARGTGGGGGPTSLSELTTVPSDGDVLIGSGTSWVTSNLTAGAGISITVGPGAITISATDGDITLDDGTAASPSLHFTNDPDTGIYRPAANTLGISVSGTQVAYFDENGLTVPSAGVVAGGSIHAGNGNANNPSLSFDGDQDTGFFRHQPNEIGIALGGTQYATLTSTTFSITPVVTMASSLRVNGTTDSSSKDTGAIVTEGGLGVEKSATIGGNLTVSGGTATLGSDASLVRQGNGWVQIANTSGSFAFGGYSVTTNRTDNYVGLRAINNTGGTSFGEFGVGSTATGDGLQNYGYIFTGAGLNGIRLFTNGSTTAKLTIDNAGLTTLAGNLTVSGTGGVQLNSVANLTWGGSYGAGIPTIAIPSATSIGFYPTGSTSGKTFELFGTGNATLSGNLTVSGGTIDTAASTNLTLNGGSSGASLVLAQGSSDATALTANVSLYLQKAAASAIVFRNNAAGSYTEAMRIAGTTGNLLIGTTTDGGQKLQVNGTAAISGGIVGTTTNNSAAAGIVGEYVSSTVTSANPVSLTSGTHANITSISLTAGDWDVVGNVVFNPQSTTVRARSIAAVHTVSGDVPALHLRGTLTYNTADSNAEPYSATAPAQRISISSTTTVYLIGSGIFSAGTLSAYGYIQARRVR